MNIYSCSFNVTKLKLIWLWMEVISFSLVEEGVRDPQFTNKPSYPQKDHENKVAVFENIQWPRRSVLFGPFTYSGAIGKPIFRNLGPTINGKCVKKEIEDFHFFVRYVAIYRLK